MPGFLGRIPGHVASASWKTCASPTTIAATAARASAGSMLAGTSVRRPQNIPPSLVRTLWRQPSGVASKTMLLGMPKGGRLFFTRSRRTTEISNLVGFPAVHAAGSSGAAAGFGADLVVGWSGVCLTGGEDPPDVVPGCRSLVLRAWWPTLTRAGRFRHTSRGAGLRAQVPEPSADPGGRELVRRCRLLPGPTKVGGQRAGEAELGEGDDHQPRSPGGGFRAANTPAVDRDFDLPGRLLATVRWQVNCGDPPIATRRICQGLPECSLADGLSCRACRR